MESYISRVFRWPTRRNSPTPIIPLRALKSDESNLAMQPGTSKQRRMSKSLSAELLPVKATKGSFQIPAPLVHPNPVIQMRLLKHIQDRRRPFEEEMNGSDGRVADWSINAVNSQVYQIPPIQIRRCVELTQFPLSTQLDNGGFDLELLNDAIETSPKSSGVTFREYPKPRSEILELQLKNDYPVFNEVDESAMPFGYPKELMHLPTDEIFRNISMKLYLQDLYDEQDGNEYLSDNYSTAIEVSTVSDYST